MQELWTVVRMCERGAERERVLLRSQLHVWAGLRLPDLVWLQRGAEEVIVRAAGAADVTAIAAIYADAVLHGTATFDVEPPPPAALAQRMQEILAADLPYLVAEDARQVLGYAYAAPFRLRAAYASTVEDSVYIAQEARGRGVGRALLMALIAACEARDLRSMLALIGDRESAASIGLHRACGFRHAGVLPAVGYKKERWLDVVVLERALGAGATCPPTRA